MEDLIDGMPVNCVKMKQFPVDQIDIQ